ncbi:hypothetical protein NE865_03761 [Phthorimaea operculella]|nr:hypothetical protein NE865_03761 [Phthorimaea operculella]
MTLKIYLQNARSIRGKLIGFTQGLLLHDYDVVAICETWLLDSVGDAEVCDSRYDVHRSDRTVVGSLYCRGGRGRVRVVGGGVMLLTRRCLGARLLPTPSDAPYDILHVRIEARFLRSNRDLNIICVYLPGSGGSHDGLLVHLTDYLSDYITRDPSSDYLITGDFNLPDIVWIPNPDKLSLTPTNVSNEKQATFIATLGELGLEQFNRVTNGNNRQLELIFLLI